VKPSVAIPLVLAVALPAGACLAPKPAYISVEQNGAIHIGDKPDAAPDSGDPK
jgi:hypothetical protein